MHEVCGYPVKFTWIKSIKAGNYLGQPILTKHKISRYYPDTNETPKGNLNQSRKNVRSNKTKLTPLEVPKTAALQGQKASDVYTSVYKVSNTVFYDQTGQFPTRSHRGNTYIMIMVEIDSNKILVEPINNCKDEELTRTYRAMMLGLRQVGIIPKKHILDNEVSESLKTIIQDEYKMQLDIVPPGTQRRNVAEVAIRISSHTSSVYCQVSHNILRHHYGTESYHRPK